MHVALVTTFYPNQAEPLRAVFVRNLATALASRAKVSVVSPFPYAPPFPRRQRWAALRAVPSETQDDTRTVFHPRFIAVPKMAMLNSATYAAAIAPRLRSLARAPGFGRSRMAGARNRCHPCALRFSGRRRGRDRGGDDQSAVCAYRARQRYQRLCRSSIDPPAIDLGIEARERGDCREPRDAGQNPWARSGNR